jgi:3-phenylpropionate/cinnamic acid dioxygenase small subunit
MPTSEIPTQPTAAPQPVDDATHREVERFLHHEAHLLDSRQYHDWLALLSDDFLYRVPVPVTRDNPALPPWDDGAYIVDETRASLASLWVKRHEPQFIDYAWGENPPHRTRHFVTNVRVARIDGERLAVDANVLLTVARLSDPPTITPAGREDVLGRDQQGALKLVRRIVRLDQTLIGTTHMRLVF